MNLTAVVEEMAIRARLSFNQTQGLSWDELSEDAKEGWRAVVRPPVERVAPIIRAQIAAEIRAAVATEPIMMHVVDWTEGVDFAIGIIEKEN